MTVARDTIARWVSWPLPDQQINKMKLDSHSRTAGKRKTTVKGTLGSPSEVPSKGTKSQPTWNNKKCFPPYPSNH